MTENLGSPSLLRRLTAIFYDSWLVLACLFALSAGLISLRAMLEGQAAMPDGQRALGGIWDVMLFTGSIFTIFAFYCYFWLKNGQTLGMQTWRIKLVSDDLTAITSHQAFTRFFAAALSISLFGLGYLWQLIDKDDKSLHDRLSGTRLILVTKRQK